MATHLKIFADETHNQTGEPKDSFGAIICSEARENLVRKKILDLRKRNNYYHEIKWSKLKNHNADVYREFADVFFSDRYMKLKILQCIYNSDYKLWEKGKRKFIKTYWLFLSRITSIYNKYQVYCDHLSSVNQSDWNSISYLINARRRDSARIKGRNIQVIRDVDSHNNDMIQLVDLLLGAYSTNSTTPNSPKRWLQDYVKDRLRETERFECFEFNIPTYRNQ
jgi:hypothetical protein